VNGATNLYVEDCDFHAYLTTYDFDNNSRAVFRYNVLDNCTQGSHGADTSTIGVRHFELYNNELIFDSFADCDTELDLQWFFWGRGGTGVITDNVLPRITSTCAGQKGNIRFSVLNTRRDSGPYCCWSQYPAPHQVGQGFGTGAAFHQFTSQCGAYAGGDYSYYIFSEPVYIWNNTGTGGNSVGLAEDDADQCGNNQHVQDYVQEGRDYIIGAKPGYQKFTYPHPLRGVAAAELAGRAVIGDFNGDGHPDFVIRRNGAIETAIWYLNNNSLIGGDLGPAIPITWNVAGAADFDQDGHPDYALIYPAGNYTAIAYMSGPTLIGAAWAPTLPTGWEIMGTGDFNSDSKPDYALYNALTRQTAIWYLNNNALTDGDFGPTLPSGWNLIGVADFDRDGHPDYALSKKETGETAIWYLSGPSFIRSVFGPTVPGGWVLVGTADFDGDGKPDFLLYDASNHQTAIWYLDDNVFLNSAPGPTLPVTWGWPAP
jgi:hypothetical protein